MKGQRAQLERLNTMTESTPISVKLRTMILLHSSKMMENYKKEAKKCVGRGCCVRRIFWILAEKKKDGEMIDGQSPPRTCHTSRISHTENEHGLFVTAVTNHTLMPTQQT